MIEKHNKIGEEKYNNQGSLMKIIEYVNYRNITVEFQDKHKTKINTNYGNFVKGCIKNPYHQNVYNIGMIGVKYPSRINGKNTKEYSTWFQMIRRCFDKNLKERCPTYNNISCCKEWLLFENFYEWLHEQNNFDKWFNNDNWDLDKDILVKGNKIYSPETCCLVPQYINLLFVNKNKNVLPIGISKYGDRYKATCHNPFTKTYKHLGYYSTSENAFYLGYKPYKENIIKQVAQEEYNKGNITKECYEAMLNYKVKITD